MLLVKYRASSSVNKYDKHKWTQTVFVVYEPSIHSTTQINRKLILFNQPVHK